MKIILKPDNLQDLNTAGVFSPKDSEKFLRIVIVDNEEIPQTNALLKRGHSVSKLDDVSDIQQLISYDILFIDIHGVGKSFGSPLQGAYVAKKAKQTFPDKKIIMITGATYDDKYNDVLRKYTDGYLPKDAAIDQWEDKIDDLKRQLSNPVDQWKIVRSRLLDADVPILTVFDLEQAYIKSIKDKDSKPLSKISITLPDHAKQFIMSLTKSMIFQSLGISNG